MDAKKVVAALGALGQETRLEVFRLLVQRGPKGLPAGAIALGLGVPPSSLTFHLRELTYAGLITQRRLGRQMIYAADFAAMNAILSYLTQNCCGGNPSVCAPRGKAGREQTSRNRRSAA
jgi:ArsR family transcriptional regulator, arsenate/arsenite/antimonite-responsive transcriptional repressor